MSHSLIDALQPLYSAVLADVLDAHGYPNQTLSTQVRALTPTDPALPRRVKLYELLAVTLWLGWMAERVVNEAAAGPVQSWTMNTMPAEERGRRFVARALAWPEGDVAELRFF